MPDATTPHRSTHLRIAGGNGQLDAVLEAPADGPCPLVIVMHGITGSKEDPVVVAIAAALRACGVATLRFDFNGHGASDGDPVDMTVPHEIDDALAVHRYARSLDTVSTIGLVGHSQGGVVAGLVAAQLVDEITALVLLAPAGVLEENARCGEILGATIDPNDIPERVALPGKDFAVGRGYIRTAQSLSVFETSARYRGAVCIIQGSDDEIVPLKTAERYRDIYGRSQLHVLEGQNHGFDGDPAEPADIAARFLVQRLSPSPS